jgi:signal transduction histidine kinase
MLPFNPGSSKQAIFVTAGSAFFIFLVILVLESLLDVEHEASSVWQKTLLIFCLTGITVFYANFLLQKSVTKSITTLAKMVEDLVRRKKNTELPNFADSILKNLSANIQKLDRARIRAEEKAEQIQRISEQKNIFISSISHELRTPLNAIIGYSEMLLDEMDKIGNRECGEDIRKIYVAGKHLLGMVNNILDLSKIEAGKMTVFSEVFDIKSMLSDVKDIALTLVEKNGNKLVVKLPKEPGEMTSDLIKVRQSILNFISNSAKFTEKGTVTLRCRVEEEAKKEWIYFDVIDTGVGMTPEQVKKIFQPFHQAEDSTSRKFGGTGLGLTITKRFCEMLNGNVGVQSEFGKGSVFSIKLPRRLQLPKTA